MEKEEDIHIIKQSFDQLEKISMYSKTWKRYRTKYLKEVIPNVNQCLYGIIMPIKSNGPNRILWINIYMEKCCL